MTIVDMYNRRKILSILSSFLLVCICLFAYCLPAQASIEFGLEGYADSSQATPRFDCEGDGLYGFPFVKSDVEQIGTMGRQDCKLSLSLGVVNRDFHLQSLDPANEEEENILYKVNTLDGSIKGKSLLEQTAVFFDYDSDSYVMNYGVSHAAPPLGDQAYIYTGYRNSTWMSDLAKAYPSTKIGDLLLPGAHDAGMYQIDVSETADAVGKMCGSSSVLDAICKEVGGGKLGLQLLANLSLTQKDTAENQLEFGTRFFDFRPAYPKGSSVTIARHLHNFIPGVLFQEFLQDVNSFLTENPGEIAFIQITINGIDEKEFQPLSQSEVEQFLTENIDSQVGYDLTDSIAGYKDKLLADIAKSGKRAIAIFHPDPAQVNDSYSDEAYQASLTDPQSVIDALTSTLHRKGNYQYTVLQLQDTGSGAIPKYAEDIEEHIAAWANDLFFSGTGNILQATKPIFDNATYQWLIQPDTVAALKQQSNPVILLNDFVESALASHAIGLTKSRLAGS